VCACACMYATAYQKHKYGPDVAKHEMWQQYEHGGDGWCKDIVLRCVAVNTITVACDDHF